MREGKGETKRAFALYLLLERRTKGSPWWKRGATRCDGQWLRSMKGVDLQLWLIIGILLPANFANQRRGKKRGGERGGSQIHCTCTLHTVPSSLKRRGTWAIHFTFFLLLCLPWGPYWWKHTRIPLVIIGMVWIESMEYVPSPGPRRAIVGVTLFWGVLTPKVIRSMHARLAHE